jgi:uncharacterized protein (TIGR03032 family)
MQNPSGIAMAKEVRADVSPGLVSWMIRHQVSLVSSACRTEQLLFIGARSNGTPVFSAARFPGAMGLAAFAQRIHLAGEATIFCLENTLRSDELVNDQFDRLFAPRNAQLIGKVNLHELAIELSGRIIFVNTRHSCLATVSMTHAFKPLWKPAWISELAAEHRCHFNCVAMEGPACAMSPPSPGPTSWTASASTAPTAGCWSISRPTASSRRDFQCRIRRASTTGSSGS